MPISELQIALLGAGAAAVAAVWGYNTWQERKHRKVADDIFKGTASQAGDALLGGDPSPQAESPRREPGLAPDDAPRMEPGLHGSPEDAEDAGNAEAFDGASAGVPDAASAAPAAVPPAPACWADPVADCVLRFTTAEAVAATRVWAAQSAWGTALDKALHWLAFDGEQWQRIDATTAGSYREWAAALQLADRRGAVAEAELARYLDGVQELAADLGADLELPDRSETLLHAAKLDQFCAAVDIQFALHIVDAGGGTFLGTKLRGVAEAGGLRLEDGVFRARDEEGGEVYSLGNLGPENFTPDALRSLSTHGLTLSLDVPRTSDGAAAFDSMLAAARQLARTLGGVLVDAQRQPLADPMIQGIRAKTIELQQSMRDAGIEPGSVRALRLFS